MRSLAILFLSVITLAAQTPITAIKAARMFDGKGDQVVSPGLVIIANGHIQSVGGGIPAGAKVIDLGDAICSPASSIHTRTSLWISILTTTVRV